MSNEKQATQLHEVLAAEKTVMSKFQALYAHDLGKLGKEHFFTGHIKVLKMINDSPANAVLEAAAREEKLVVTNVYDTVKWTTDAWADSENLLATKNRSNQNARADILVGERVIANDVPVDELMGLENRLVQLRDLIKAAPTLDAAKNWENIPGQSKYLWKANPEVTTKTEKIIDVKELTAATDKFPAQVKEFTRDEVVGQFTRTVFSGATTTIAKSESLTRVEALIVAVKQARTRANNVPVTKVEIGRDIVDFLLEPIKDATL